MRPRDAWERVVVKARRNDWEEDREMNAKSSSSSDVFDLRREERVRANKQGDGTYETRLNQQLRSRSKLATQIKASETQERVEQEKGFLTKVGDAWRIFFPT